MLNIFKYYKNTFLLPLKFNFSVEGFVKRMDSNGDKKISYDEANKMALDALNSGNEELGNKIINAMNDVFSSVDKVSIRKFKKALERQGVEIVSNMRNYHENRRRVINQSRVERNEINESPFTRSISYKRPYMQGPDVTFLLQYLNAKGFNTKGTKKFGPAAKEALKNFQKRFVGLRHPDGRMDFNGATMRYILRDINRGGRAYRSYSETTNSRRYGKEASEVIGYLSDVEKFITAFNKVYGGKGEIISRDNGILGIVARLGGSSLDRLVRELKPNFSRIDKKKLARELGLSENSKKFKEGLIRTAVIAAISAIMSGGSSVALELFGINYGENLKKGPEMRKILRALRGKNVDMRKEMRDMYLSRNTTVAGLNRIVDILNNPNMDTANLKRFIRDIYQPNWFQRTFGIFLPEGYKQVENLIKIFERTGTTRDALAVVKEIYKLSHRAYRRAKKEYIQSVREYNKLAKEYKKKKSDPLFVLSTYASELEEKYNDALYRMKQARKDLERARAGLGRLGRVAARFSNLDAKRAQIQGERFDRRKALQIERQIDQELGRRRLRRVREKLHSSQSFGYRVDINRVRDPNYMARLLNKMRKETINGRTSVLAGVMRGIKQHYGIEFTADEFINAFIKTAEPTTSDYVLSNLGRERNQKFQGKINGKLFKIDLNGTPVYFKDSCTNIVTVAQEFDTTTKTTNSIPVVINVSTGHKEHVGDNTGNSSTPGEERGGSTGGGGGTPAETEVGSGRG